MRYFKKIFLCIMLGALFLLPTAGVVLASNLPNINEDTHIICYPLNCSDRTYAASADNRYIDPGDECYITEISGDYVYVVYPTASGRHGEYFEREGFTTADIARSDFPTITATRKVTTYRNSTGNDQFGYLEEGDLCYILTKMHGRTQLIYPVSAGYKMGWVDSKEIYEGSNAKTFSIHSALDTTKVIDVDSGSHADGTNILLYSEHGGLNQGFELIPAGNYYVIVNTGSGKALDVQGGVSGSNVQLFTVNYSDAQLWEIMDSGEHKKYYLRNKLGYFMDVCNGSTADCTNIWVYEGNASAAQKFMFKRLGTPAITRHQTYLLFINGFSNDAASANTYSQIEAILGENRLNNAVVGLDPIAYDCESTGISSGDFESALSNRLSNVSSNDTVFIYLAAHGNSDIFGLGDQIYHYNSLLNLLRNTQCGKIVLLLEPCRSGTIINWVEQLDDTDKERFIILTSSDTQTYGQYIKENYFLFGKALADGLSRNGSFSNSDWNKDSNITVKELADYVTVYMGNKLLERNQLWWFDFGSIWDDQTPAHYAVNEDEVIYRY